MGYKSHPALQKPEVRWVGSRLWRIQETGGRGRFEEEEPSETRMSQCGQRAGPCWSSRADGRWFGVLTAGAKQKEQAQGLGMSSAQRLPNREHPQFRLQISPQSKPSLA